MSEASELLNGNDISAYTAEPETEGRIIVGNDRFITVPEDLKRIAVQNDHDIETVTFECPRYWDNHDMSEMDVYVQYLRPDGVLGRYLCEEVWIDETDDTKMLFNWTVSGHVTPEDGKLTVQVCVQKESEGGTDLNHWNSELNEDLYISKGLDCGGAYTSNYPSQVKQIVITESPFMTHVEADEGYQLKTVQIKVDIPVEEEPVPPDPTKPIRFYDYEGTLVYSYTVDELTELKAPPELPEHEGLVGQGWNTTLDNLMIMRRPFDVGAMYTTDDGKTRLYITLEPDSRMDVQVYITQSTANGVTIDWGDGKAQYVTNSGAVSTTHTYAATGDYVITLSASEGTTFSLGGGGNGLMYSGGSTTNLVNGLVLRKVEIGDRMTGFDQDAFTECYNLKSVSIPNTATTFGSFTFERCRSLKHVTIPSNITATPTYLFSECTTLESVSLPSGAVAVGDYLAYKCPMLKRIVFPGSYTFGSYETMYECSMLSFAWLPETLTAMGQMFYKCESLVGMRIPGTVTSINDDAFYNCSSLTYLDFTEFDAVPDSSTMEVPRYIEIRVHADMYDAWKASDWESVRRVTIVAV